MNPKKSLNKKRARRVARNRAKIFGTAVKPRLSVSRSNRYIYAQLIDDENSRTLTHVSNRELPSGDKKKTKTESATLAGELLAKRATDLGIKTAVMDRRAYKYHGRVKALTEGARKGGLKI